MTDLTIVPTTETTDDTPFSFFIAAVAEFEAVAATSGSTIKELTGKKNTAKITAYAHIIAGLKELKVRKGTKLAGTIKEQLIERGVSKACAKRYLENGQKAKALAWVKAAGSDADAILAAFAENGVKTEQDLVNIVSPKPVLTAAEELAAKAVALTDSDDDAVKALREALATFTVDDDTDAAAPLDIAA